MKTSRESVLVKNILDFPCEKLCIAYPVSMKYFSHMPFKGASQLNNNDNKNNKMSEVLSIIKAKEEVSKEKPH